MRPYSSAERVSVEGPFRLRALVKRIASTLSLAALALAAAGADAQPSALPGERWLPLLPVEAGDAAWRDGPTAEVGPADRGRSTVALRWSVDRQPAIDSPPLLHGWSEVERVRFRLHLDRPRPYRLAVVLTGPSDAYFLATVPLDFTGWSEIELPLSAFSPVMRGARLDSMSALGFRAQGYGQPSIEEGTIWWIDRIEIVPHAGAHPVRLGAGIETNRVGWETLAALGNPFVLLNTHHYSQPFESPWSPPALDSTWQYTYEAERLVGLAFAAADPSSPLRGRPDLVARAIEVVDWLVSRCSPGGWWWHPGAPSGDPNVNRFTLSPLLDSVRWLRQLPEGRAAWHRWRERLDAAIALQRRAYDGRVQWDWGGLAAGRYANQDSYYALICALSADLYGRPADRERARAMVRKIAGNILPDGGISYMGRENESPGYHALDLRILGRYATLTRDPVALSILRRTANYWPLTLTAEGQPEYWSDAWWKQYWSYGSPEALVVAAGATHDPRNQWLMWRALERTATFDRGMAGVYSAPWWPGEAPGRPMPEQFVVPDRNIRGVRGRDGDWYFGVVRGRGLRSTFVGGLVSEPTGTNPLRAAFRGAQIHVFESDSDESDRWLSEADDAASVALHPQVSGALGVRYTLQPSLYNGVPTPRTPPSPWRVTQTWHASARGDLGVIVLEATRDAPAVSVAGRLALGPSPVVPDGDDAWRSGPLRLALLRKFGTAAARRIAGNGTPRERAWDGVELLAHLDGQVHRGDRFVYAAWVGPEGKRAPRRFELLPNDAGWTAEWEDGHRTAVVFNFTEHEQKLVIPWTGRAPRGWGAQGLPHPIALDVDAVTVLVSPGKCVLVE